MSPTRTSYLGLTCFFILSLLGAGCSRLPLSIGERIEKAVTVRPQAVREKADYFNARWSKNLDPEASTGNMPIGVQEPLVHEGVVFVGANSGEMNAYALENGRLLWSKRDNSTYHTGAVPYQDQILYGTVQGRLVSRHRTTGELKYEIDLGAAIESKIVVADGRGLVQLRNHQLFCLDIETGKILWAYRRSVPYQTTIQRASTPVVQDSRVYVGFADGQAAAFSLEDGLLLWERRLSSGQKFVDVDTEPLLYMNQLYMGSHAGQYTVMDPQSGNTLYQMPYTVTRRAQVWNNQLLMGTTTGDVVLMARDFRELKKINLKSAVTSVRAWRDVIVAATVSGHLYALDPESFEIVESHHLGHAYSAVFGELKVEGDRLIVLSSRGRLYTF